uniref:Uncharacterized protein n=1 Tax=Cyanoderma ruficeps TaxID=181631 RepID=A0A8C3RGS4_9PASS
MVTGTKASGNDHREHAGVFLTCVPGAGLPTGCALQDALQALLTHHPIDGVIWPTPLGGSGQVPGLPLPCFWLMSAGRWGEWEPWLKCGCTPCDGCTTGTLLDCKTQPRRALRSQQDPPARRASALCSSAVASKARND